MQIKVSYLIFKKINDDKYYNYLIKKIKNE